MSNIVETTNRDVQRKEHANNGQYVRKKSIISTDRVRNRVKVSKPKGDCFDQTWPWTFPKASRSICFPTLLMSCLQVKKKRKQKEKKRKSKRENV